MPFRKGGEAAQTGRRKRKGRPSAALEAIPMVQARRKAADLQDRLLGRPPQPARAAPPSVRQGLDDDEDDDDDDDKAARAKIIAFYQKHNPNKVRDVDALIIKYRDVGVGASELLLAVQKKYARSQEKKSNQFSV